MPGVDMTTVNKVENANGDQASKPTEISSSTDAVAGALPQRKPGGGKRSARQAGVPKAERKDEVPPVAAASSAAISPDTEEEGEMGPAGEAPASSVPAVKIRSYYMVRIPRPSTAGLTTEIQKIEAKRASLREQQQFHNVALTMKEVTRSEIVASLDNARERLRKVRAEVKAKQEQMEPIRKQLKELTDYNRDIRSKSRELEVSNEEELDALIASMEARMMHHSLPLAEEKRLVRQIKKLQGAREEVRALASQKSALAGSQAERDGLSKQLQVLRSELDVLNGQLDVQVKVFEAYKREEGEVAAAIKAITAEKAELQHSLDELWEEIHTRRKTIQAQEKLFYNNRREIKKLVQLAESRQYEAAEELSRSQVERTHERLATDAEFRALIMAAGERRMQARRLTLEPDDEDDELLLSSAKGLGSAAAGDHTTVGKDKGAAKKAAGAAAKAGASKDSKDSKEKEKEKEEREKEKGGEEKAIGADDARRILESIAAAAAAAAAAAGAQEAAAEPAAKKSAGNGVPGSPSSSDGSPKDGPVAAAPSNTGAGPSSASGAGASGSRGAPPKLKKERPPPAPISEPEIEEEGLVHAQGDAGYAQLGMLLGGGRGALEGMSEAEVRRLEARLALERAEQRKKRAAEKAAAKARLWEARQAARAQKEAHHKTSARDTDGSLRDGHSSPDPAPAAGLSTDEDSSAAEALALASSSIGTPEAAYRRGSLRRRELAELELARAAARVASARARVSSYKRKEGAWARRNRITIGIVVALLLIVIVLVGYIASSLSSGDVGTMATKA